jgi:hypothetical protein
MTNSRNGTEHADVKNTSALAPDNLGPTVCITALAGSEQREETTLKGETG